MNSIVTYRYDKKVINNIKGWQYGNNWPIVYIYYNDKKAYVGETLDAVRRTEQHIKEPEFDDFKYICLISNKTFNKSVVLDLESFLIKYMGADGKRKLINGNAGVVDHNYFYKEAYEDDFKAIWQYLLDTGVVQNSLFDIENSELFKYSPYKTLNKEQFDAVHQILNDLSDINNATSQSIIQVSGGAGTGKTILAVYLVKLLTDIKNKKDAWKYIDDPEEAEYVKWLSQKLGSINNIGFVVPMKQLRTTMKKIFKTIDGLSEKMIYAPEEVTDKYFDLLVVDEAHRLYKRNCLTSADLYITFDEINRKLMAEHFTGTENDLTELDWIIRSSRMQVLFYDEKQAIRSTDIGRTRYEKICKNHIYKYIELFSQMRCKGGNGYYEYIRDVLFKPNMNITKYKKIEDYDLKVVDSMQQLETMLSEKNSEYDLCKLLAGPAWSKNEPIIVDSRQYHWVDKKDDDSCIYSIHKIQGFDLNYAGVIFGNEVFYDDKKQSIEIENSHVKDVRTKRDGELEMRNYILNIYLTLMTRGIKGTYIYAVDEKLRKYLKLFLNQQNGD